MMFATKKKLQNAWISNDFSCQVILLLDWQLFGWLVSVPEGTIKKKPKTVAQLTECIILENKVSHSTCAAALGGSFKRTSQTSNLASSLRGGPLSPGR